MVHNIKPAEIDSSAGTPTGTAISLKGLNNMSTITIDLATAKSIASLINIASKPKSVAPVLEQVRCNLYSDGMLVAVATDRYAIITASYDTEYTGETVQFGITHAMAKFITGLKGYAELTLEISEELIVANIAGQTYTTGNVKANYPPVAEMVAKWQHGTEATPVELDLSLLSRLTKIVNKAGKKVENWKVELGKTDNPSKPAPIRLLAENFGAIQQPRLTRP